MANSKRKSRKRDKNDPNRSSFGTSSEAKKPKAALADAPDGIEILAVCWNVRNLSDNDLNGRGMKGLPIPARCRKMVQILTQLDGVPDLLFVLEAGDDANRVAAELRISLEHHVCFESGPTGIPGGGQEQYVCCVADHLAVTQTQWIETPGNYRNALALTIHLNTTLVGHFVILHAPSPGHGRAIIREVMNTVTQNAVTAFGDDPIILCGDFNTEENLYEEIEGAPLNDFNLIGPRTPTSLRALANQLDDNPFSQFYDQVWCNEAGYVANVHAADVVNIPVNFYFRNNRNFRQNLLWRRFRLLIDSLANLNINQNVGDIRITRHRTLENIRRDQEDSQVRDVLNGLINFLNETVINIQTLNEYIGIQISRPAPTGILDDVHDQVTTRLAAAPLVPATFNEFVKIIGQLNVLTRNWERYLNNNYTSIFFYWLAISDHLPVTFTINLDPDDDG